MATTISPSGSTIAPGHPILLSVPELSVYLNIKPKTLYAKAEAGEIPHYRIGRIIRFRLDEIDAWLEGCRNNRSQAASQKKVIKRKPRTQRSMNQISAIAAKAIDEERDKYYALDHGKSDRIEDF
ncbi:MAG TPA: helix-turn-helix domain-containing protein [Syntrophorhabdus sp.]|nr:helix-turn-helix domain-containing protein [Syntrophorhabdus sp.]